MTVRYSAGFHVFRLIMNKMRNGRDGKTSEMRPNERNWSKPMAQFGENVCFRQTGEDGVCSFSSRMTQGIICHFDRTGAVLCITKSGVVRGQSWTRQTLSDPWDATNWSGLCGTP